MNGVNFAGAAPAFAAKAPKAKEEQPVAHAAAEQPAAAMPKDATRTLAMA